VRPPLVFAGAALSIAISACGSARNDEASVEGGVDAANASVVIGVPAGTDGLDFAPLPLDGELRLQSFGQGGIHVLLAIRCIGFGNRAFVTITVANLLTGAEAVSPAPVRPQLLLCHDADVCDLVPVLVMVGGLAETGTDRNGLHVRITAEVHNAAGVGSQATQDAVFSTADL
jgi:hypothetical protein